MKIYHIVIVACLIEQLKAKVYPVELNNVGVGDESLATVEYSDPMSITILNDINPGDIKVSVAFLDGDWDVQRQTELDDPCNMDTSTEEGTLAAILWTGLGIDSCPIAAGNYPLLIEFNQTGVVNTPWREPKEYDTTIIFEPMSQDGKSYFELWALVQVEKPKLAEWKSSEEEVEPNWVEIVG